MIIFDSARAICFPFVYDFLQFKEVVEMKLDRETGIFVVGDYAIEPRLTYLELETKYKDIQREDIPNWGEQERIYLLPTFEFQTHHLQARIVAYRRYISGIYIGRVHDDQYNESHYRTSDLIDWTQKAHAWLRLRLGEPHMDKPGVLFDEAERFKAEEIAVLRSWEYIFEWGRAGYYYDSLEQPGDIFIHPSYHHQVRNWDELLLECDDLLPRTFPAWMKGNIEENLPALKAAIGEIRHHFDYLQVRPIVTTMAGLIFELKQWSQWENPNPVSLEVNIHARRGIYCVSRPDLVERAYTNDLRELIKRLHDYINGAY